ncbi:hypothetical protein HBI25_216440 [Parastagonospora nodorum]|nr:hypothetical protein HBI95_208640 [Parastagonospora nodorum]KAH4906458.1 hypothetical protein HBI80_078630 [Parastagonospora nodorum]KAH5079924.1 hypothetical protein HBH95_081210 [Parastagonospora nodorum]KAH5216045.1 hypothetical protein HBI62_167010 [Parastagonospora nodorum]KAH5546528.1 hypothetical protein HBI25_216440 [Parastagonospora nodorum]
MKPALLFSHRNLTSRSRCTSRCQSAILPNVSPSASGLDRNRHSSAILKKWGRTIFIVHLLMHPRLGEFEVPSLIFNLKLGFRSR